MKELTQEQIAAIAAAFTKGLQAELTAASWSELLARHNPESAHCPSHDYCDSNMVMLAAIESCIPEYEHDASSQEQVDLWESAWTMASKTWGRV